MDECGAVSPFSLGRLGQKDGGWYVENESCDNTEGSTCNPCFMQFYGHIREGGRRPSTKELLRVPSGADLPRRSTKANAVVRRHVYASLQADKVVYHEDMERLIVAERRANTVRSAAPGCVRRIAQNALKDLGKGVGDVTLREYSGSSVEEDRPNFFAYVLDSLRQQRRHDCRA